MNPSNAVLAARLLTESNPVWAWAIAVTAVGLLVAALMVLVQDTGKPGRRAAIWGVVIFMIPIIGPAFYLIWETVRYHREHGRPEKGMVEKYAPEEVAQRREEARREEARRDEDRRGSRRGDDADAAAD
ncbi:PLD nuclease N-terminal domain-containing protein [Nesterenkonia sp. LB17]|uniref:PLD nuclease N-terminal domain-containing protein n=1 Tax=unclassified Nesterenkonia TaxID=2629769 RepID=UPI001F4C693D|nr:PLD nuclease N-terminal domain-containing protein [Nesterenkonia sp. DZ6]MCH8563406.1 PLD nuclease N-terminal domain-containing protein [Nesterenkonia sp. YGD6]MCH8566056.1 PLD nuclease N-terminal domain-containing protein [Nesterenkonia sp. LB17]MCH8571064.1 PLD nuclease N-terminal domain-containing protein [Nesterenkonia sp. AY15]